MPEPARDASDEEPEDAALMRRASRPAQSARAAAAPPPPAPPARAPACASLACTVAALVFFGGMLLLRLSDAGGAAAAAAARRWSSRGGGGGGGGGAGALRPPPGNGTTAGVTAFTRSAQVPTSWRVVSVVPRDGGCFTQGLSFRGRVLYESCGLRGQSLVRRVSLAGGAHRVLAEARNPDSDFGEGLALWPPEPEAEQAPAAAPGAPPPPPRAAPTLLQLTWQERAVVAWDADTLAPARRIPFSSTTNEGWGLASDGRAELVMSDGSSHLHFWSPDAAVYGAAGAMVPLRAPVAVVDRVRLAEGAAAPVRAGALPAGAGWAAPALVRPTRFGAGFGAGSAVGALNELDFAHGWVLANIWYDTRVAIIHPRTGAVVWYLDFSALLAENRDGGADVLNGLAYTMRLDVADADGAPPRAAPLATAPWAGRLWLTGKLWRNVYEVELGGLVDAADLADLGDASGTGVRRGRRA